MGLWPLLLRSLHTIPLLWPSRTGLSIRMKIFNRPLVPGEKHALGTIERHDEIEEWLSPKADMRIMHSSAGGYGTVYCVGPPMTLY